MSYECLPPFNPELRRNDEVFLNALTAQRIPDPLGRKKSTSSSRGHGHEYLLLVSRPGSSPLVVSVRGHLAGAGVGDTLMGEIARWHGSERPQDDISILVVEDALSANTTTAAIVLNHINRFFIL